MASRFVETRATLPGQEPVEQIRVQGFRTGLISGAEPVVVVAITDGYGKMYGAFELSPESANVLGEYLRQEAEFAGNEEESK